MVAVASVDVVVLVVVVVPVDMLEVIGLEVCILYMHMNICMSVNQLHGGKHQNKHVHTPRLSLT